MRNYTPADLDEFIRLNADPQVMEFFPAPWTPEESRAVFEKLTNLIQERGWGLWALEEKATGKFIGFTGLSIPSFEASFLPAVEVGWRIFPEYWNKGFASEAAQASIDFGLDILKLPVIYSFTTVGNVRSQRVMEKIGMKRRMDLDFLHPRVPDGSVLKAHVVWSISRDQ